MISGCYTALITPFSREGRVDYDGLDTLVEFQRSEGVSGVVAIGTTGESATLSWDEHLTSIDRISGACSAKCRVVAGTGSNSTEECIAATKHVVDRGIDTVLLVDPYYNGPSSLEIRREYYEPLAREFDDIDLIPYVIPGRTGTMLSPEDLAILARANSNIVGVKDAMGDIARSRRVRELCPNGFSIISGDDDKTFDMLADRAIRATAAMSVMANVVPGAIEHMIRRVLAGDVAEAMQLCAQLKPLFELVTVVTTESSAYGPVDVRARNPVPVKTLMALLGMPSGPCRRPLGRMTEAGLARVLDTAKAVHESTNLFRPIEEFFGVDIRARLGDKLSLEGLAYDLY